MICLASCRTEVSHVTYYDLWFRSCMTGTPINRLPIMAKQVLDLYELYNLVVEKGGLVEVINKKQWQEIIKGLNLPSSITSAAFTLRSQYTRYLVRMLLCYSISHLTVLYPVPI